MTPLDTALATTAAAAEQEEHEMLETVVEEEDTVLDAVMSFVMRHPMLEGIEPMDPSWHQPREWKVRILRADGPRLIFTGPLDVVIGEAASALRAGDGERAERNGR